MIQSTITQQTLMCIYRYENPNCCLALSNVWMHYLIITEASQISSIYYHSQLLHHSLISFDGSSLTLRRAVISSNPDSFCFCAKVMLHNRSLSCCTYCHSYHTDTIKASESRQKIYFILHHKEARFHVLLLK